MEYYNGDVYEGLWKNDKRNGRGIETKANGIIYDAYFLNDVKEGSGAIIKNGRKTEGRFNGEEFRENYYPEPVSRDLNLENGVVYNERGDKLGRIDAFGDLYDSSGHCVGRIDNNGEIYDKDGCKKGRIEYNGEISDINGYSLGKVKDGEIMDGRGYTIGRFGGDNNQVAGAWLLQNNN